MKNNNNNNKETQEPTFIPNYRLIGIAGKKNSGKDTVANYIEEKGHYLSFLTHHLLPISMYHLADPLKCAAMEAFKLTKHEVYDETAKEKVHQYWGLTPRKILQLLGTEGFRNIFGEDFWLRRADLELRTNPLYQDCLTLVPDIRFENECDWIRDHNGLVVHVFRRSQDKPKDTHASEQELKVRGMDWVIDSPDGVDNLKQETNSLIDYLFSPSPEKKKDIEK